MDFINRILEALLYTHPIHSITVHFPIALTAVGFLFLLLALIRRNLFMEHAAFYCMTLAAISTVVAWATGYYDYQARFEGEAPYVNLKMFLGISLFVVTTLTAVVRWRQPEILWKPATRLLYTFAFGSSFALAAVLGFLGGSILYGF